MEKKFALVIRTPTAIVDNGTSKHQCVTLRTKTPGNDYFEKGPVHRGRCEKIWFPESSTE